MHKKFLQTTKGEVVKFDSVEEVIGLYAGMFGKERFIKSSTGEKREE